MKLRNKIYVVQILIIVSFILSFIVFYESYIQQKNQDLDSYIQTISQSNKIIIEESLKTIYQDYNDKKKSFYKIHKFAKENYLNSIDKNLYTLREKIKKEFNEDSVSIDIFIIDKNYTIFESTFEEDIGFNLGNVEDAMHYLNKTKKDGKIYVASNLSFDILDSNINIYSYSKLTEESFFEVGFKTRNNSLKILEEELDKIYKNTNSRVSIYRFSKDSDGKEFYVNILKNKPENITKEAYANSIKKFNPSENTDNKYIKTFRLNKVHKEILDDKYNVYIPLLTKDSSEFLTYNNILVKVENDISEYRKTIKETQNSFILFALILLLFMTLLYYFIRFNFYKPMEKLTKIFEEEKKVDDNSLLRKNDEFGVLVKKYNKLYLSLHNEIQLNSTLLEENKRFIADTVHQIRTPLTNIMMNAELVKKFQKDDSLSLFIDQIDASINMLSNSYEDLAYVTSYDNIDYKPKVIDLSELLKKRAKFFSTISRVNFKNIVLKIEEQLNVLINDIECERLIDNNISNAIKYASKNKDIEINLFQEKKQIVLEFKSFGTEIKNKDKIFDKNYRENEAKRGWGLGLNMVKEICKKNDISYEVNYQGNQNIFRYIFESN